MVPEGAMGMIIAAGEHEERRRVILHDDPYMDVDSKQAHHLGHGAGVQCGRHSGGCGGGLDKKNTPSNPSRRRSKS